MSLIIHQEYKCSLESTDGYSVLPQMTVVRWVCFCKVTEKVFTYCYRFAVRERNKTSIEVDEGRNRGLLYLSGSKPKSHVPQSTARIPLNTRTCFRKETSTRPLCLSYYAVRHRNSSVIICQHLNENYASNCGATMGNCILATTPEGKNHVCAPDHNANST